MPDISIKEEFLNDISSVKNAGKSLSGQVTEKSPHTDNYLSEQIATETTRAFSERCMRFSKIVTEYQRLLIDNLCELERFYQDINDLDKTRS